MSRKQSTVQRIRKKASGLSRSNTDGSSDPYHNGETPSCRLLVEAVQDIFPELYPERQKKVESSELGQLLRWQVLKRRQERVFPPALPLTSSEEVKDSEDIVDTSPTVTGKKKKKKKKKKKENEYVESSSNIAAIPDESRATQGLLSGTVIEPDMRNGGLPLFEFGGEEVDEEEAEIASLNDGRPGKPKFRPSLDALDRSLHEMEEERSRYEDEATPDLLDLPSDDAGTGFSAWDAKSHASALSFDEIPLEDTERHEDNYDEIPVAMSPEPIASTSRHSPQRIRASSTISLDSLDGFSTHTKEELGNSNHYADRNPSFTSPNHEWVPEENAEAKTETPPGDAIKNPLSLSYLLSLNTDNNGMTTTTINGRLIYAEKASARIENYQLGNLEATKLLMEDWLGQVVILRLKRGKAISSFEGETDLGDFIRYMQTFVKDGNQPRGIPYSQLVEAVEQIECAACRGGVSKFVEEWSDRAEDKPLVLNPCVLDESPSTDDSEVDAAFDYVAFEEGHHLPKQLSPVEDGVDVDLNVHMSFSVRESDSKNNVEKCLLLDRINPLHLNTLVETWLPCGIDEEDLVNTSINDQISLDGSNTATVPEILDPDEVKRMQSRILSRIQMAETKLFEIHKESKELLQDLEQLLSDGNATQNINILAFTKIKAVDDKCTTFKGRVNAVVKNFSDGVECAGETLKFRLWTAYLEAMNKALKACDVYYEKLAETADQRGKLPNAFVSAPFRDLVQGLVKEKITAWTDFVEFIHELFSGAALQEYITRMIWHTERAISDVERSGTSSVLYRMCNDLSMELSTWTETIVGSKMGDIYQIRMAQTEQILEHLQQIIEPLSEEYASVEKYFSTERNLYFASLRSNIVLAQGVKTRMRLIDNAEVEGMVTGVLLIWTHVRLMQNRMIHSVRIPPLPLQLKRFMLHNARSLDDNPGSMDTTLVHSRHQRHCLLEVNCKRKAMCILVGLVYRWLKELFDLWKAQKAEQELLNGFHVPEPPKTTVECPKPTKSKKSKKKKAQKSMITTNLDDSLVAEENLLVVPDEKSVDDQGLVAVGDEKSDDDQELVAITDDKVEVTEEYTNSEKILEGACVVVENQITLSEEKAPDDHDTHPSSQPPSDNDSNSNDNNLTISEFQTYESEHGIDFSSKVFIEDGPDRISPEDFLMARLHRVMFTLGNAEKVVIIS